jgi:hypothetical protein
MEGLIIAVLVLGLLFWVVQQMGLPMPIYVLIVVLVCLYLFRRYGGLAF